MAILVDSIGLNIPSTGGTPKVTYDFSCDISRISNSQIKLIFTIKSNLPENIYAGSPTAIGTGIVLDGMISLWRNNVKLGEGSARLKEWSDKWNNDTSASVYRANPKTTKKIEILIDSYAADEYVGINFEVIQTEGGGTVGEVARTDLYVTTPELLFTKCGAPTEINASPSVFDDEVVLSWYGATEGVNNVIKQYKISYAVRDENSESFSDYFDLATTSDVSCVVNMSDKVKHRQYVKFAVMTEGEAGEEYFSDFAYSQEVQRKVRNVKVKQNGKQDKCCTFVKQNGKWVESEFSIL